MGELEAAGVWRKVDWWLATSIFHPVDPHFSVQHEPALHPRCPDFFLELGTGDRSLMKVTIRLREPGRQPSIWIA